MRSLRGLKNTLRLVANAISQPAERAANPYATHVPVLIGLSRLLNVRRVVEYGCGQYSTLTFLNRLAFPRLVELRSLENDAEWFEKMAKDVGNDPRAEMIWVNGPMSSVVPSVEMGGCDLVFLDDSANADERAATIQSVAAKRMHSTVVVIHDYETLEYRRAARAFTNRFNFNSLNPNTGVLWNNAPVDLNALRSLNKSIKRYADYLPLSDVEGWVRVLTRR
jgi:hypothetical protein